jgi:hypothetical protein
VESGHKPLRRIFVHRLNGDSDLNSFAVVISKFYGLAIAVHRDVQHAIDTNLAKSRGDNIRDVFDVCQSRIPRNRGDCPDNSLAWFRLARISKSLFSLTGAPADVPLLEGDPNAVPAG